VGRVLPVLLEGAGRHPGQMIGRTPYLQPVHLRAPGAQPGQLIDALIEDSQAHSLAGAPVTPHRPRAQGREACA
jgi:tRNA-2-methylthio-N6-dimethylallyladenosine synthase